MTDLLQKLFSTEGFMPHGHCYLWTPSLLIANVASDTIIFLSYFAISFTLILLIAKCKEIPFQFIYAAFGAFIVACGLTHLVEILNVWIPAYWFAAMMKVITAIVSLGTACLLPFYFPKARDLARGALLLKTRQALRESEELYKQIVDTANEGIWLLTPDNKTKFVNQRMADILGYEIAEMQGQSLESCMDKANLEEVALTRIHRDAGNHDFRMFKKDGSEIWVRVACRPLLDQNGNVTGWLGMLTDITNKRMAEEKLKTSELHFRSLIEAIPQHVWSYTSAGKTDYSNHNLTDHLGCSPENVLEEILKAVHPEEQVSTRALWEKASEEGNPAESEYRLRRHDGEYRWQLGRIIPLRDSDGRVLKWMGIATDIHEQKEDQRLIYESQAKLRVLSEFVPQMIWTSDPSGQTTYCNKRMTDYTGLRVEDFLKQDWITTLHPSDRNATAVSWLRSVKEGSDFQIEFRVQRASDKTYRWHLSRALPMCDEQGKIVQWFGTVTDIHDQKVSEEFAGALKKTLSTVLDNAPIILWTCDVNGILTYAQGKALEKWNKEAQDYIGRHVREIFPNWERSLSRLEMALEGERITAIDDYLGNWFECHHSPLRNRDSEIIGMVVVATDITERRIAEIAQDEHRIREASAQEASRLKSEFLAHMSHEIRTPLNGVMGMINLIAETPLSPEQRDYADHALSSGSALMSVIDDILDFSKIEAGKLDFEEIDFDLYDLVKVAEKGIFYSARAKGLRLYNDFHADIPAVVKGDPNRLRQVLNNLLSNALKFTEEGSIAIRSRRILDDTGVDWLEIEVSDTGIGISQKNMKKLFNAFTQADSSTTRRFGGTGLGLSISKHLVELMGGQISVTSVEGQGSQFCFTLPLKVGVEINKRQSTVAPFLEGQGARILVADDNSVNRKIILKFLDNLGYRAQAVGNGRDALIALAEDTYDLILMDCNMPELDGYECTRIIRSIPTHYQNIPIVALTAGAMKRDYDRCMEAGMNAYVAKPVKKEQLQEQIESLLVPAHRSASEMDFVFKDPLRSWNHSDK